MLACSPKPEQALIGKWQDAARGETIEFLKDGTFEATLIWDLKKAPVGVSGTYVVKGNSVSLTVEKPPDLAPMIWQVKFSSPDDLTAIFQQGGALKLDGASSTYRKIK